MIDELVEKSLNGEKLSTARLISMVERKDECAPYIMEKIFPHSGKAYYLGVTGPPGAGKSTTVDRLITMLCKNNYSVGVIAVDPSSPFSGGSLLGDRVRMHVKHDKMDVFIRSMSSGRVMGGSRERARRLPASSMPPASRSLSSKQLVWVNPSWTSPKPPTQCWLSLRRSPGIQFRL